MGRGSGVREASKSSIEVQFYYRGVRCKERVKLSPTPKNIKYCQRWKSRIEDEVAKGEFDYKKHFPDSPKVRLFCNQPGDIILLKNYLEDWLEASRPYSKASTHNGYQKIVRGHLIPAFGEKMISELSRKDVKDWTKNKGFSPKTQGNIISPLRIALDEAVEDELIDHNPLAGWKIKRKKQSPVSKDKVDPFDSEEREAILAALDGQGRNLMQFAFWSGLRTSELCALDWGDIDWLRGVLRVSRAFTQSADEPEEPKTEAGIRDVKLLPPALDALKAQKTFSYLKGEEIFQNPRTGERWTGDQPIRKTLWTHALKKAGVRYRNPYQTRHTFASMMMMACEHVMWVAQQMGHRDWTFTARTYSRYMPDDAPEAGNKAVEQWATSGTHTKASR